MTVGRDDGGLVDARQNAIIEGEVPRMHLARTARVNRGKKGIGAQERVNVKYSR
jgi:hypothetical protein